MFKLKNFESEDIKNQKLAELKKVIDDLKNKISVLKHIEAGINISTREVAFDAVLVSEFENNEDLQTYLVHPEHVKLADFLKDIRDKVAVVDYIK